MMSRIWYPQLDVYHAIRRLGSLIYAWDNNAVPLERLYITDFYLANPPLLHSVRMPSGIRDLFNELQIQKPEKAFLTYPTPSILFHKMEPIQKKALQAMLAKEIVESRTVRDGVASLSNFGEEFAQAWIVEQGYVGETNLVEFLSKSFSQMSEGDTADFRKRTGLRRMI